MSTGIHTVLWQGEVLPDRTEAGKKRLCRSRIVKNLYMTFAPGRGLVTVFGAVIQPRRGLHEHVPDAREFSICAFAAG
ncbi:hypothetical protein LMG29542_08238 [Paraburkholderia humisilvae]|uniref:Uncharacterized protein n=1 Tax=Paraburkholderia humisilvae TaxID=627669 RepID=A0A6J5FC69_9BURK|nr:hypothetical protein LMG29542_08238 [Paraburkholderia humisilvae]